MEDKDSPEKDHMTYLNLRDKVNNKSLGEKKMMLKTCIHLKKINFGITSYKTTKTIFYGSGVAF